MIDRPGADVILFKFRLPCLPTLCPIFFEMVVIRACPLCTRFLSTSLTFLPRDTSLSFSSNDPDRFSPFGPSPWRIVGLRSCAMSVADAGVIVMGIALSTLSACPLMLPFTGDGFTVMDGCCVRTEAVSDRRMSCETRRLSMDFRPVATSA